MVKKNLAKDSKVIQAIGIGLLAAMSLPMYANAQEAEAAQAPEDVATAVTQENITIPTESISEAEAQVDINQDGDTQDHLEVVRDEEALASVDPATIQQGTEGLTDPVKVAELTFTDHAGDELTKEEADEAVAELAKKYDLEQISVTENTEAFEEAVAQAEQEIKQDLEAHGCGDATIQTTEGEKDSVVLSAEAEIVDTDKTQEAVNDYVEQLKEDKGYTDEQIVISEPGEDGTVDVTAVKEATTEEEIAQLVEEKKDELAQEGYVYDVAVSEPDEQGKIIISASKRVENEEELQQLIEQAKQKMEAAGFDAAAIQVSGPDEKGQYTVSVNRQTDAEKKLEAAKQELVKEGFVYDAIVETTDEQGNVVLTVSKLVDDEAAIEAAKQELVKKGYLYDTIQETKNELNQTVLTVSKLIDDEAAIEAAKQKLVEKGYAYDAIEDAKQDDGQTVLFVSKQVDDEEAIEAAKKSLEELGYARESITETKNEQGQTVLKAQKLVDGTSAIEAAKQTLVAKGFAYADIVETKNDLGQTVLSVSKQVDDEAAIEAAKQALVAKGYAREAIQVTKNEQNQTVLTVSKLLDDASAIALAKQELIDAGYDQTTIEESKNEAGQTVVKASKLIDDTAAIAAAKQALVAKGYDEAAIEESKNEAGETVLKVSKLVKDEDAVAAAKQALVDKGYDEAAIQESKNEAGQTVLTVSKLVKDNDGIAQARLALKQLGYADGEIVETENAAGDTVLTASKLVKNDAAVAAAKQALLAKGYTEAEIQLTENQAGQTILTASKVITDNQTRSQIQTLYRVGDQIVLDGKTYTVTEVTKDQEFVSAGSTISEEMYNNLSDAEKSKYTKIADGVEATYVSVVVRDGSGNLNYLVSEEMVNEGTKIGLKKTDTANGIGGYTVIALQDFTNGGHIDGSIFVGGTLHGTGGVDNCMRSGSDADNYLASYVNNVDDSTSIYMRNPNVNGGQTGGVQQLREVTDITDEEAKNTADYWQAYYRMLLRLEQEYGYEKKDGVLTQEGENGRLNVAWSDDAGNKAGDIYYLTSENGIVSINDHIGNSVGKGSDIQKIYIVDPKVKKVNVTGTKAVVIAPNADVYLANFGEGSSAGCVIGNNVYNNGAFYDQAGQMQYGGALELHTSTFDLDIEGKEIVKTSAIYSTSGQVAQYTVKATRQEKRQDSEIVNPTTKSDQRTVTRKQIKATATVDQKKLEASAQVKQKRIFGQKTVDQNLVSDGEVVNQKTIKDGAIVDREAVSVETTVDPKTISDREVVAQKTMKDGATVAQKQVLGERKVLAKEAVDPVTIGSYASAQREVMIQLNREEDAKSFREMMTYRTAREVQRLYRVEATTTNTYYGEIPTPVTPDETPTEDVGGGDEEETGGDDGGGEEQTTREEVFEVLGARRMPAPAEAPEVGSVLGARRTGAVLGARRGAHTGDAANMAGALGVMVGSAGVAGAWVSTKRKREEDEVVE